MGLHKLNMVAQFEASRPLTPSEQQDILVSLGDTLSKVLHKQEDTPGPKNVGYVIGMTQEEDTE